MIPIDYYISSASELLTKIISIPAESFSEKERADYLFSYLSKQESVFPERYGNNIIVKHIKADKPTLMLCAHIDTVPPANGYSFDPINPPLDEMRILGLGSNDDGASVVSMIAVFCYFVQNNIELPFNILLALSCEEERSGQGGMKSINKMVEAIADFAIVGEPTCMKAAIAEKGLLVIDGVCSGKSAHCAHWEQGDNALYKAVDAISAIKALPIENLNITQIHAGSSHNVIPDICNFVIDIRTTGLISNEAILATIQNAAPNCSCSARNMANHASAIAIDHPLVITAKSLYIETYISPTTSDWMRISIPAIKMGPGDSDRSHKADEFVYKNELAEGINTYIKFISHIQL